MKLTPQLLRQQLAQAPAARRYWVAFSGGRDSHVLLHCAAALRAELGADLRAVHVHHGLQPQADHWVEHCAAVCAALAVELDILRIDASAAPGQSPEAAARDARYRALSARVADGDVLLTAHHRNDQAETVLLQLLRGSGPAGLAAMPACSVLGRGLHLRPLLALPGRALAAYAARFGLRWVEDHSNRDLRFDRNFVREQVAPVIARRWPAWDATLARAAHNSAESAHLAEQLGAQDLAWARGERPDQLQLEVLRQLDPQRRRNLLRCWLRSLGLPLPSRAQLERLIEDVIGARGDAGPLLHWRGVEVRRYRDRLFAMTPLASHDPQQRIRWDMRRPLQLDALAVRVTARPAFGAGVRCDPDVADAEVRFRCGGERLRPRGVAHRRQLKTLFQEYGVAPWQRDRIPLLYLGDQLAAVGELWIEDAFAARAGERGFELAVEPLGAA